MDQKIQEKHTLDNTHKCSTRTREQQTRLTKPKKKKK